jgi:hypothetical protein
MLDQENNKINKKKENNEKRRRECFHVTFMTDDDVRFSKIINYNI